MKKYVEKMKRFWNFNAQNKGGFTLVELIVVIAILAILAGIAVPAYSGYVEKARKAEDEQLLATVNTAFAAACIENGTDAVLLDNAYATLNDDGTVAAVYRTQVGDSYNTAFDRYYDLDEKAAFKVIKMLTFKDGVFVEGNSRYAALIGAFNDADIDTFNESVFATIGFDVLMGKVDLATLTAMDASDGSTLNQLVMDSANKDSLAKYLGFDNAESEGFEDTLFELIQKKATQLAPEGTSEEDMYAYYELAEKQLLANNAVLVAATNSNFDTATFAEQLAAGNGKNAIKTSMNTDEGEQVALSQTAMAYAMYTSYIERNGGTASNNITEVLDVLESDGFKNYMSNTDGGEDEASADMQGYLAAMNMINSASDDSDAVSSLLVNGFTDPDLLALLTQEIN